ncbi:MAG TPA: rod shape-determining protein [Clostridiaceae bacterium]|nr:rod shape-determining protein [Clostridiaceae bacterium]
MGFLGFNRDLGIDLGTASILVYIKGKGIVLNEPSVVATDSSKRNVLAVGEEAKQMIGRTPGNIIATRPLKDGVISDYDVTERMLRYFIKKSLGRHGSFLRPRVIVCIPCEATEVEKRAVKDAALSAGAGKVFLIEEPVAAAIGAGLDISRASGSMVVDIGGGTTDIAFLSLGGMVVRSGLKIAGDKFDEAIVRYIRKKHNVMIGERTAEELKINVGSAFKRDEEVSMDIKGRDLVTGLPKNISVTSEEMRDALEEPVYAIVDCVHSVLERTPPELAADIINKGIVMTGGGSLLNGLDKLIESRTGVPTRVASDAICCVALGTGKVLENIDQLGDVLSAVETD